MYRLLSVEITTELLYGLVGILTGGGFLAAILKFAAGRDTLSVKSMQATFERQEERIKALEAENLRLRQDLLRLDKQISDRWKDQMVRFEKAVNEAADLRTMVTQMAPGAQEAALKAAEAKGLTGDAAKTASPPNG